MAGQKRNRGHGTTKWLRWKSEKEGRETERIFRKQGDKTTEKRKVPHGTEGEGRREESSAPGKRNERGEG